MWRGSGQLGTILLFSWKLLWGILSNLPLKNFLWSCDLLPASESCGGGGGGGGGGGVADLMLQWSLKTHICSIDNMIKIATKKHFLLPDEECDDDMIINISGGNITHQLSGWIVEWEWWRWLMLSSESFVVIN